MLIQWPSVSPTLSYTLPDPALGDTERRESAAIIRENRGGQTLTYNDSDWPINKTLSLAISTMTRAQKDSFESFLTYAAADEILLTFDSKTWLGIIITPVVDIVTVHDDCTYDASFEFLGEPV